MGQMVPKSTFYMRFSPIVNTSRYVSITMRSMSSPEISGKTGALRSDGLSHSHNIGRLTFRGLSDSVARSRRRNWLAFRSPPSRRSASASAFPPLSCLLSGTMYSWSAGWERAGTVYSWSGRGLPWSAPHLPLSAQAHSSQVISTQEKAIRCSLNCQGGARSGRKAFVCNALHFSGIQWKAYGKKVRQSPLDVLEMREPHRH